MSDLLNPQLETRLQKKIDLYETIINEEDVGLARKMEIAEILRVLFYVRDGVDKPILRNCCEQKEQE